MGSCSKCQNTNVIQRSSLLTRLLLSIYIFLNFYFFTGDVDYGAIIALLPLLIPYHHVCMDCDADFWGAPKIRIRNFWLENLSEKYLLAMTPSILTMTILILKFPYTGLERIVYLPAIYVINSIPILIYLLKSSKINGIFNFFLGLFIQLVTVVLSILFYPK